MAVALPWNATEAVNGWAGSWADALCTPVAPTSMTSNVEKKHLIFIRYSIGLDLHQRVTCFLERWPCLAHCSVDPVLLGLLEAVIETWFQAHRVWHKKGEPDHDRFAVHAILCCAVLSAT